MDPNPGNRADTPSDKLLTYEEFATRLGVLPNTVTVAVRRKKIAVIRSGKAARISATELQSWEKRFTTLNDTFSWLQPTVEAANGKIETMSPKAAGSYLGISPRLANGWCQQGLLPFFVRSFTDIVGGRDRRAIVKTYVHRLVVYTGMIPVYTSEARDYFTLCSARKQIV